MYHDFEVNVERLPFSHDDALWAAQTFGELEGDAEIEEFEEWLDDLSGREFWAVSNALDALRSVLKAYSCRTRLAAVLAEVRRSASE